MDGKRYCECGREMEELQVNLCEACEYAEWLVMTAEFFCNWYNVVYVALVRERGVL